jgi:hypothetical protein
MVRHRMAASFPRHYCGRVPRLIDWLGRRLRFSPEGKRVRVWVEGWPGEEDSRVLEATVLRVSRGAAVLELDPPARLGTREVRFARAAPRERGFGLDALWFSFIAVDAEALTQPDPKSHGEALGRWALRLADKRQKEGSHR